MDRRTRILGVFVSVLGMTFLSGVSAPAPASAARREQRHARIAPQAAAFDERHRADSFELVAANNGERITVHFVDGVLTEASAKEARHLMRALSNDQEHDIDPRLLSTLFLLARETGGRIDLISAYRPPANRYDHNFHSRGMAADVRLPGYSPWGMRNLARKLGVRGLGMYPTTNMIHVDVRDEPFSWVDYSGPTRVR
jgi:uncharacterized protein YcbK (DUF882 family)